jgi:hypothetical protein
LSIERKLTTPAAMQRINLRCSTFRACPVRRNATLDEGTFLIVTSINCGLRSVCGVEQNQYVSKNQNQSAFDLNQWTHIESAII